MNLTKQKQCEGECPACGSDNLNYYDAKFYDGGVDHCFECLDCHKQGVEYYAMTYGYTELTAEEEELIIERPEKETENERTHRCMDT